MIYNLLNSTIENTIPLINTYTNNNLETTNFYIINYYIKKNLENILILCQLYCPYKEDCIVNYNNNLFIINTKKLKKININKNNTLNELKLPFLSNNIVYIISFDFI